MSTKKSQTLKLSNPAWCKNLFYALLQELQKHESALFLSEWYGNLNPLLPHEKHFQIET